LAIVGPDQPDDGRWTQRLALAALAFACLTLVLRYFFIATTSLTYDEATYVDLARHPWHSSYYPDSVFARHPPLAFLILGAWTSIVGESEAMARLPGLLFCLGTVLLVWDAVQRRAGAASAALAGILLALSFSLLVYGIQATMYPPAAFFAALAAHADGRGRDRATKFALTFFALTHLFGFVFLALWIWRRADRRRALVHTAPAWLWLVAATVAVLAARNPPGPGLGPAWQAVRGFELFYDLTQNRAAALQHAFAFLLSLLLLNPILLETAWFDRLRTTSWGLGLAALTGSLFTGPSFLRFTAPLLPVAFLLGFQAPEGPRMGRRSALAILIGLAALTSATAYVNSGLDAGAQNDVPGLVDWRHAAMDADAANVRRIVAPAPPPIAFYLGRDEGFHVASSAEAPDLIPMVRADGRHIDVWLAHDAATFRAGDDGHALLVVPDRQTGTLAALFEAGYSACGSVRGAYLLSADRPTC
jgi:4-amino-4-deoxy-L-arabinose transferase-like glycosyltransferase